MNKASKLALIGLAFTGLGGNAMADEDAQINAMSYATSSVPGFGVINVYSSDGQQWDTIDGPPVKFTADMDVDTQWPGYVKTMGVFNGYCVNTGCQFNPKIASGHVYERDLHWNRQYEIKMSDIPVSGVGVASIPLGDQILQTCNANMSVAGPVNLYVFNRGLLTSFSVQTRKAVHIIETPVAVDPYGNEMEPLFNGGDATLHDSFSVQVRCNPYQEDFDVDDNPDFAIEELEMFLSTFSNEFTEPEPGFKCKKGRILTRVTTNQAGPVKLRLWTAVSPANTLNEKYIETWSGPVGSGVYQAEYVQWVSVQEDSILGARVELENAGYSGVSTDWDTLDLECIQDTPDFTSGGSPTDRPGRPGDKTSGDGSGEDPDDKTGRDTPTRG